MNRYIRQFEGQDVEILYDDVSKKVFFRLEDVARAAGFTKVSSLRYHTKEKVREVKLKDGLYLKARALNKVAKAAVRTPGMARFASWAAGLAGKIIVREDRGNPIASVLPAPDTPDSNKIATTIFVTPVLYTLSGAAVALSMTVKELSDWLVDEGYAGRYKSNNSVYFMPWFKMNGLGTYPVIQDEKGTRFSRVPKLTKKGLEFIEARLESQRQSNVLSFAKKEVFQEEKRAEQEIDELIIGKFSHLRHDARYDFLIPPNKKEYRIAQDDLINKVKELIAEVKLKE